MSDNDLATFLRARREAVTPAEVGLPTGPRRRTPGLRRAELATIAGVSVEYLTRLEQGRDRHPSNQVLMALADALRLSAEDRMHLRFLSKAHGGNLCQAADEPAQTVRPTVQALLDGFEPGPAVVINRLGDVLAFTAGYERLAGPIGLLDTRPLNDARSPNNAQLPNLIRFAFTDARARIAYPDWERVANERVAHLRLEFNRSDPYIARLADELAGAAGTAFTNRLRASTSLAGRTGVERLVHPDAGELRLAYEILELPAGDAQHLVAYLPADNATSDALHLLAGRRPGALRAVRPGDRPRDGAARSA